MNNYPSWWDTTVTIYNRYEDPQTNLVSWHRHVVEAEEHRISSDSQRDEQAGNADIHSA